MQEVTHLDDRGNGNATIYHNGKCWKRIPTDGLAGAAEWVNATTGALEAANDERNWFLENAYHHPETTEPVRRFPRTKSHLKVGQPVFFPVFGSGEIEAIAGDQITVRFGNIKRRIDAQNLMTRAQAEADWHAYYLTGTKRRLEEGKRLLIVKSLCRFGEWQDFLKKYEIPRSTADDLIRRYRNEAPAEAQTLQLTGNRSNDLSDPDDHANAREADPEDDELAQLVKEETEKRRGKVPTHHPTWWNLRIKLPQQILDLCRKKYKKPGAKEYWRRAAYQFVGKDPDNEA